MWDVGCGMQVDRITSAQNDVLRCLHKPRATGHELVLKPPPQPSPKGGSFVGCGLRAAGVVSVANRNQRVTGHEPQAIRSSSPRTTYHEPRTSRGKHTDLPLRRDDTHHEPRATCRCFVIPAKRTSDSREPIQTGTASAARGGCRRQRRRRGASAALQKQSWPRISPTGGGSSSRRRG